MQEPPAPVVQLRSHWRRRALAFAIDYAIVHLIAAIAFGQAAQAIAERHDVDHDVGFFPGFDADATAGDSDDLDAAGADFELLNQAWYPVWIVIAIVVYGLLEAIVPSPGKLVFGLRVNRLDLGHRLGWRAFLRNGSKAFIGAQAPALAGFLGWLILIPLVYFALAILSLGLIFVPIILDIRMARARGIAGQRWLDLRLGLRVVRRGEIA